MAADAHHTDTLGHNAASHTEAIESSARESSGVRVGHAADDSPRGDIRDLIARIHRPDRPSTGSTRTVAWRSRTKYPRCFRISPRLQPHRFAPGPNRSAAPVAARPHLRPARHLYHMERRTNPATEFGVVSSYLEKEDRGQRTEDRKELIPSVLCPLSSAFSRLLLELPGTRDLPRTQIGS